MSTFRLNRALFTLGLILAPFLTSCGSEDLLDLALDPPSRKSIAGLNIGVNNFFVNPQFGSKNEQFSNIQNELRIRDIRILMAWTNGVQPSPDAPLNFSFYDDIVSRIPSGVRVVVVLAHTPDWITNSANWINGNPRTTFIEKFLKPTVARYANSPGIEAWEVWNEPDLTVVPSDIVLGLEDPNNYMEMLAAATNAIRSLDSNALILNAATSSIQQNFPKALDFNKAMKAAGVENLVDVYNVHYYGSRFESVVTNNGVQDFLNSITKPLWLTESGETGPNEQLAYVETAWPFLKEKVPGIDRFYYYEYGSTQPLESNYGLRTTDPAFPVSDLYIWLRDNYRK